MWTRFTNFLCGFIYVSKKKRAKIIPRYVMAGSPPDALAHIGEYSYRSPGERGRTQYLPEHFLRRVARLAAGFPRHSAAEDVSAVVSDTDDPLFPPKVPRCAASRAKLLVFDEETQADADSAPQEIASARRKT